MLKVGDLVKHKQFAWIGQVIKSEKEWFDWQCLSNWRDGIYPWRPNWMPKPGSRHPPDLGIHIQPSRCLP